MTPEQSKVKAWMQKAGQETPDKPTIPSLEVRQLRAKLILEEAFETIEKGLGLVVRYFGVRVSSRALDFVQSHKPNLVELADGCADLAVVNLGTACACGIDLEPVFNEVCRSNDSKFVWGYDDLMKLPANYEFTSMPIDSNYTMAAVKDDSGKLIKPPTYSPANIAPILENQ